MARARRVVRYLLVALAVLVALAASAVWVLTHTEFGVRQAGRIAVSQLRDMVHGELRVGSVSSPSLLRGVMLHDIAIDDSTGQPFLRVDSARLSYHFRTLISGKLVFDRLTLYSPEVFVERLPGQKEPNYNRIFPPSVIPDTMPPKRLVAIDDITAYNGLVVVRMPWRPSGPVQPGDTSRLILDDVPGGKVRVTRIEDLNGRLPRLVWESPGQRGHLVEVGSLSGRVYVWRTPAIVRQLSGTLTLRDSVVSFDAPTVELPSSTLSMAGQIVNGQRGRRYDLEASSQDLSFADLRWLYPTLPTEGGGSLDFRLETRAPGSTLFLVKNAKLHSQNTQLAGSFGIVTGDTLQFTDVDLRASPLNLKLLRSIVPMKLPLEGLLIGTVEVKGPVSALDTRGDLRYLGLGDDSAGSSARWNGRVRARGPYAVTEFRATVDRLDLGQLARFIPGLRLRGEANGSFRAEGSLARGLTVEGEAGLRRGGEVSRVRGGGRILVNGKRSGLDLRLDAEPVALELLAGQFPAVAPLTGRAEGTLTLSGPLDSLKLGADLRTPAGRVQVTGGGSLRGPSPRFALEGAVTEFGVDRVFPSFPETQVTGTFKLNGTGRDLASAEGRLAVDVVSARVAGIPVYRGVTIARLDRGLARVDSFSIQTGAGEASLRGSFGLVRGRVGELHATVRADSIEPLEPLLFTGPPEGALGMPLERRLAGRVSLDATLKGSVRDWTVEGRASGAELRYSDLRAGSAHADFSGALDDFTLSASVDSLHSGDRFLPGAATTLRYRRGAGAVRLRAQGIGPQNLELESEFQRLGSDAVRVSVNRLGIATKDARWTLADTVLATVGRRGFSVDSLVLERAPVRARIRVAGVLPWSESGADDSLPASLAVDLDSVRVGEVLRLAQVDSVVDGVVTGRFRITGTARSPVMTGRVASRPFRYAGAVLDSAGGEVRYRDRLATAEFAGWRAGEAVVTADASVPLDLGLVDLEDRLQDRPLSAHFRADSVPASLVSFLAPGFSGVEGRVDADLAMVGRAHSPDLEGELRVTNGTAFFEPLLVRYRNVNAVARMRAGRQMDITASLRTENGSADVKGRLDLTRPSDPGFDLDVTAKRLDASRRRDVTAVADGRVHVGGRYARPVVSGDVQILRGEMNLDEIWRQYQIVQLDTSMFQLFDSTTVSYRPSPRNPFLDNLVVSNLTASAAREMWLRSRELDMEVSGALEIEADLAGAGDLRLTGTLEAVRGTYDLQVAQRVAARRFDIRSGNIEFVGTPGIDPNLDVQAAYRVRRAEGDPIDVVAALTGTLQNPRVQLTTDSDLQVSESDLASYLLFGRSRAELTQAESDVVSSGIVAGLRLLRPALTGFASSELQRMVSNIGIDYLALRTPEYDPVGYGAMLDGGALGFLGYTQLEIGFDLPWNMTVIGSARLRSENDASQQLGIARFLGARVQYRFLPTWTGELYLEDRFARTPSFGLAEIDDRKAWGFNLVREWGY